MYVSYRAVRLNGLTITPKGSAAVIVYPATERVIPSNATVTWGGMTVKSGKVNIYLGRVPAVTASGQKIITTGHGPYNGASGPLVDFDGRRDLPDIGGFKLDGSISLRIGNENGHYFSRGAAWLRLPPDLLTVFGGQAPSAAVALDATNSGGPVLDNLDIQVPYANLGAVVFTDGASGTPGAVGSTRTRIPTPTAPPRSGRRR